MVCIRQAIETMKVADDSSTVAMRRSHQVAAVVEREFERARLTMGYAVDQIVLSELAAEGDQVAGDGSKAISVLVGAPGTPEDFTLPEVYDTTRQMVLTVLGEDTRIRSPKQQSGAAILRNRFEIAHLWRFGSFLRNIDYDQ